MQGRAGNFTAQNGVWSQLSQVLLFYACLPPESWPALSMRPAGYAYQPTERPSQFVPWNVQLEQGLGSQGLCNNATFCDVACSNPAENANVSVSIQSVEALSTAGRRPTQSHIGPSRMPCELGAPTVKAGAAIDDDQHVCSPDVARLETGILGGTPS